MDWLLSYDCTNRMPRGGTRVITLGYGRYGQSFGPNRVLEVPAPTEVEHSGAFVCRVDSITSRPFHPFVVLSLYTALYPFVATRGHHGLSKKKRCSA